MTHRRFRAGFKLGYSLSGLAMLSGILVARAGYQFAISSARRIAFYGIQQYSMGIWRKLQRRWHPKSDRIAFHEFALARGAVRPRRFPLISRIRSIRL